MKQSTFIRTLVVLALVLVMFAGLTIAQSTKGTIAGVVTDKTGAVIPGASVTATAVAGIDVRTVVTGNNGEYRIEPLTPGDYKISVTAKGFSKTNLAGVVVRTSVITSANLELTVGASSEVVTVEAQSDTIQTESGELSKTLSPSAIQDLPYGSQNPYSLAVTLPGVSTVASRDSYTNGSGFSVNGLRPRSNNFLIDGFDNNDNGISGQALQPANTESVQEVTVLTNAYMAEFGRGGGSVSNLSFKSGSNQFHGALWEQYSGAGLDAIKSEDQRASNYTMHQTPQYVNNIFGFRVGGPVLHNKLYFFATSQWNRYFGDPGAGTLYIPTVAGFNVLNSLAASGNAYAQLMVQTLGTARSPAKFDTVAIGDRAGCLACTVDYGLFKRTDKGSSLSRESTARVDYSGASDNLYLRYTDSRNDSNPDLFANGSALQTQDTLQGGPSRNFGAMWAHTFSTKLINEFRFSAQQIDFTFAPTPATLGSSLNSAPTFTTQDSLGFYIGGFSHSTFPQGRGHQTFQFQDAASWNVGNHSIKLGADLAIMLIQDQVPFNAFGSVSVSSGGDCSGINLAGGCTDLANYLDGFAGPLGSVTKSFGNPRQNVGTNQQAYYIQDSWKLRSNLTLDFGVRYEFQPLDALNTLQYPSIDRATVATDALLTRHAVKTDKNNFAPRFGFAYTPNFLKSIFGDQKTVIRGGYGVFYDAFFTNLSNNVSSASPNAVGYTNTSTVGRGPVNPLSLLSSATAVANLGATITSVDSNFVSPLIQQWNLNVQRELPLKMKAEVAYVGTRGERLWDNEQLNPKQGYVGGFGAATGRVIPTRGSIVVRGNKGDSIYHGLQTSLTRNVGFLQLRGSYTYSKAIDNMSEVFVTSGGASRWQNVLDPRSDRAVSAFDRTHRATISYSLQSPSFGNKGFMGNVFGGWNTTGVVSFQSGTPETIWMSSGDQNGDGETANDRPWAGNPNGAGLLGKSTDGGITFTDATTLAVHPRDYFQYLYIKGTNGNISRNSYRYPGSMNFDASIMKNIKMPYSENQKIQLRMDMLNAFNHPNLGVSGLSGNVSVPSSFLNLENTRYGGRSLVLWMKYMF